MGGKEQLPVNSRLVMASIIPVKQPGKASCFHPELLSLLQKNQITIPPLRERQADIIPLAMKNIREYGEEIGRSELDIDASVPPLLEQYTFPGNIRELEAIIKRAVLCSQGPVLTALDFYSQQSTGLGGDLASNTVRIHFELGRYSLAEIQGLVIQEVLRLSHQDKDQAARHLHISRQALEEQLP
jgi:DNA-binding NtrC family response regulator